MLDQDETTSCVESGKRCLEHALLDSHVNETTPKTRRPNLMDASRRRGQLLMLMGNKANSGVPNNCQTLKIWPSLTSLVASQTGNGNRIRDRTKYQLSRTRIVESESNIHIFYSRLSNWLESRRYFNLNFVCHQTSFWMKISTSLCWTVGYVD